MTPSKNLALAAFAPLAYLLACALLAAALAYPLFLLSGSESVGLFRKLVSRGGQAWLFLGLILLAGRLGLSAASLGLRRGGFKPWLGGFGLGALMLGLHVLGLVALGIRGFKGAEYGELGHLPGILAKALATGVAVGLLEELLFRGALFGFARRHVGAAWAVPISAFYYALLHFLGTRWVPDLAGLGWDTGFRIVADAFAHLRDTPPDAFLALFCAGLLLGSVRALIPASLALCMGLHAGWVFVIKAAKPLTYIEPDARWAFLVASYDHVIGYLSAGWLALVVALLVAVSRRRWAV